MKAVKLKFELFFESLAIRVCNHPWKVILGLGLMTVLVSVNLSKLTIDVSNESFFHENDRSFLNYQEFQNQFGRETGVILALDPPKIWDLEFLDQLKALHEDLENEVPYLEEVTSLVNVTAIRGTESVLIVKDLLEDWPQSQADLQKLEAFANSIPAYQNTILSKDGKQTVIVILADVYAEEGKQQSEMDPETFIQEENDTLKPLKTKLTPDQINEFIDSIDQIVERYRSEKIPIYVAGGLVVDKAHSEIVHSVVGKASVAILVVILILLGFVFRTVIGVFLPLLVIGLSFSTSLSIMGLSGIPLSLISQIFPPLLLAFGVLDSVHLLTLFYQKLQERQDKRQALVEAMKYSGPAMLFTSMTTATGFISFYGSGMLPISDLGIVAPFGVMAAYIYSILLIPAVIMLVPVKPKTAKIGKIQWLQRIERGLQRISLTAVNRPKSILLISGFLLLFSILGVSNLRFSFNTLTMFPEGFPVRVATEWIDQKMQSSNSLEVIVDTGRENGIHDPVILNKLEQMNRYAESLTVNNRPVAKSTSVVDTLKQIHKSLNKNSDEFYDIPQESGLIAQEFILFENGGSDDLEDLVDNRFSKARVTIRVPNADAVDYIPLRKQLQEKYLEVFKNQAKVVVTGGMDLSTRSIVNVMEALGRSYTIAGILISVMMILFLTSLRSGLLSMIPNFFPIVLTLGTMGWLDIPVDMMTLLGGSVALGLAVDDTVHFMYHFKCNYEETKDARLSVQKTFATIGRAIFLTTLIMVFGFLVFIFAPLNPLKSFGLLTSATMVTALLADLLVAPALVVLVYKNATITVLSKLESA